MFRCRRCRSASRPRPRFSELNNPPFLIATTLGSVTAFTLAMVTGRVIGDLSLRKATMV
jgi:malonate transporter